MTLMGWIKGDCPPGRRMAVSRRLLRPRQPAGRTRPGGRRRQRHPTRGRGDHEHQLVVRLRARPHADRPPLLARRRHRAGRGRSLHRRAPRPARRRLPAAPRRGGGASVGSSPPSVPTGPRRSRVGARVWSRSAPPRPRGARPGGCVDAVHASSRPHPSTPSPSTGTTPWPVTPCVVPPRRTASGSLDWSFGRAIWDVRVQPDRLARPGAPPSRDCGRGSRSGWSRTGWPPRCATGPRCLATTGWTGPATCASTSAPWPTPWPPACRCRPTSTGRWWTTTSGAPTGRASGSSAWTGATRPARWLDTEAQGDDAAGEYARVLAGLRAGDRSVLDAARLSP